MNRPLVSIIAALSENRVIGKDNKLLWQIPADLQRFKKLTSGHVVIMGSKTFASIGKPLPYRTNIIVTRDHALQAASCVVVHSLEDAIAAAQKLDTGEIFVIGGGQIYEQALKYADKLYLTIVKGDFAGDTYFPDYSDFKKVIFEQAGGSNGYTYRFLDLEK